MAMITTFDGFILVIGWLIFMTYHECIHQEIYRRAKARPKFILHPTQLFDFIPTRKPKPLSKAEELQCWNEIISYNILGGLIMLFCILIVVFK